MASWIFGPQIAGTLFLIMGLIFNKFPPKKINELYGYRTLASKKNQQTWDVANRYAAKYMIRCGIIVLIIGLLFTGILKEIPIPGKIKGALTALFFISSGIIPCILLIVATEKHLDKIFGNKTE
jgi:uncharacterized membrane protein